MKIAYIAGAYRTGCEYGILQNIRLAQDTAVKYWRLGYSVITPHLNSAFMGGIVPDEQFIEGDLEIVRRVDVVVMLPNWIDSRGAKREHQLAKELGKEIIYERNEEKS